MAKITGHSRISHEILTVRIPEGEIERDLSWLSDNAIMGEGAVKVYLIRNLKKIEELPMDFRESEFIGLEVKVSGQMDLLYRNGQTYYVVEVKRKSELKSEGRQVLKYAKSFEMLLEKKDPSFTLIIPVLVTTRWDLLHIRVKFVPANRYLA